MVKLPKLATVGGHHRPQAEGTVRRWAAGAHQELAPGRSGPEAPDIPFSSQEGRRTIVNSTYIASLKVAERNLESHHQKKKKKFFLTMYGDRH